MIELTVSADLLRRKPGLTWEEFLTYWREVHAPLVKSHAKAHGGRRYVQLRTLQDREQMARMQARNGGAPEPFDGVAELWFDDQPSFVNFSSCCADSAPEIGNPLPSIRPICLRIEA